MKNKNEVSGSNINEKKNEIQHSLSRRSFMKQSLTASAGVVASSNLMADQTVQKTTAKSGIKITDLRCAIMGNSPVVRITTDAGNQRLWTG